MTEAFGGFYRGRSVLVTGHTGFKGGWLATWLHKLGARVVGYALEPEHPRGVFMASGVGHHIASIVGDVRDAARLRAVFEEHRPEVAFHLAAQAYVLRSYADPRSTFEVNVGGTVNFLEAARASPSVRAALCITSDKCYENVEQIWGYREEDRLGGKDPYSASKAAAEMVIAAYASSFFGDAASARIASARAGNVIGGGDWGEHRLVPDAMRALYAGQTVPVRNPHAVRPWQHVLEPLGGYLLLGQRLVTAGEAPLGAWNFGPSTERLVSVRELVEGILGRWGGGTMEIAATPSVYEAGLLALDCSKARARLGWRPTLGFPETVALTVDWYRRLHDGASQGEMHAACAEQVDAFVECARRQGSAWAGGEQ